MKKMNNNTDKLIKELREAHSAIKVEFMELIDHSNKVNMSKEGMREEMMKIYKKIK